MDRVGIKLWAKEKTRSNKWNIWKGFLAIFAASLGLSFIALLYVLRKVRNIKLIVVSLLPLLRSHFSYFSSHATFMVLKGISNFPLVNLFKEL